MTNEPHHSVPGLEEGRAMQVVSVLEERLVALLDLQLVLKHIHWNVVGPNFISVHEMLDGEVEKVRDEVDAMAERIRTLGGTPRGTVQAIVDRRTWADYPLDRALAMLHLEELDKVYDGVIADHRKAMAMVSDLDPVTEDLLIQQIGALELFQWFVRSFVERSHDPADDPRDNVPGNVQQRGAQPSGASQTQNTNDNQPEGVSR